MEKLEISLSPTAVGVVNRILNSGSRVQIDYDPRTKELKIYRVPRMETKYKVTITNA